MFEVFLSPLLTTHEKTYATTLLKEICPEAEIVSKIAPSVLLRISSRSEILFLTNPNFLTITPLCLKHMKALNIKPNLFQPDWKIFCNFFLYQKKFAFLNIEEELVRRYTTMIKCMGGKIEYIIDKNIDYVITSGKSGQAVTMINFPSLVSPDWIDALFYETQYIKPINFFINKEQSNCMKKTSLYPRKAQKEQRRGPLKTPLAEMKSMKGDNPGFLLRKKEKIRDIQLFLEPKCSSPESSQAERYPKAPTTSYFKNHEKDKGNEKTDKNAHQTNGAENFNDDISLESININNNNKNLFINKNSNIVRGNNNNLMNFNNSNIVINNNISISNNNISISNNSLIMGSTGFAADIASSKNKIISDSLNPRVPLATIRHSNQIPGTISKSVSLNQNNSTNLVSPKRKYLNSSSDDDCDTDIIDSVMKSYKDEGIKSICQAIKSVKYSDLSTQTKNTLKENFCPSDDLLKEKNSEVLFHELTAFSQLTQSTQNDIVETITYGERSQNHFSENNGEDKLLQILSDF